MKKTKTINLPRGYLSYSQMTLWEKNPKEYERVYFYGGKGYNSKYMDFGSEVADDAEHATSTKETVKALNVLLPTYKVPEHKIEAQIKTRGRVLNVLGKLDQFSPSPLRFRERKTGTVPWTQAKVDKHVQIDFYYMLIFLDTGYLPDAAHLDWAQTRVNEDEEVELTGEHKSYPATRTMTDVLKMISRVTKVALEIEKHYNDKLLGLC